MTNEERLKANIIAPWVTKLALLTSAGQEKMTKERVLLYVQLLASEFPIVVFTDKSLSDIAKGCEFFPPYATLKTALEAWYGAQVGIPKTSDAVGDVLPNWLRAVIMRNCGDRPGPKLQAWMDSKTTGARDD